MQKMRVGILFGGKSVEHEVSVQSARGIFGAMDPAKFDVVLIGIDKLGRWQVLPPALLLNAATPVSALPDGGTEELAFVPGSAAVSEEPSRFPRLDVVIPVLHGSHGEDGTVQGLLRLMNVPFVGAGVLGSAVGMDKDVAKRLLRDAGIPVARFLTLAANRALAMSFEAVVTEVGDPFFVKPCNAGSSVGVSKVQTAAEWAAARDLALRYDRKLLAEEYVAAREVEVGVLGNEDPQASVCGEIIPRHEFYSYAAKYLDENGAELRIPADLPADVTERVRHLALQAFAVLECSGLARVDFFVTPDFRVLVNEINTLPGFTRVSMYPKLWEATGVPYSTLIERLIALALERSMEERKLETEYRPELEV